MSECGKESREIGLCVILEGLTQILSPSLIPYGTNSLQYDKILDWYELKAFADNNICERKIEI